MDEASVDRLLRNKSVPKVVCFQIVILLNFSVFIGWLGSHFRGRFCYWANLLNDGHIVVPEDDSCLIGSAVILHMRI